MLAAAWGFVTSKVGKIALIVAGVLAALGAFYLKGGADARDRERARKTKARLEAVEEIHDVEREAARRSPDERARRVRKWARRD